MRALLHAGLILALATVGASAAPSLVIDSPAGGETVKEVVTLSGRLIGGKARHVTLDHNGHRRRVPVVGGRFFAPINLLRGDNRLLVEAGVGGTTIRRRLLLKARLPHVEVEVSLTWAPRADLDLVVIEPGGERLFYGNPRQGPSRFGADVVGGGGPEVYRSTRLRAGRYRISVRKGRGPNQVPVQATLRLAWRSGGRQHVRTIRITLTKPGSKAEKITDFAKLTAGSKAQ